MTAYKLITRDTVEEKILKLQEKNAPPSTPRSTRRAPNERPNTEELEELLT